MATIFLFFDSYVNWPSMPRSHLQNSKEFLGRIEASRANLHEYKRIVKPWQFWNKVYTQYTNTQFVRQESVNRNKSSLSDNESGRSKKVLT